MIAIEEKAAAYDKACELAAAATKKAKASYTVVLHTLLEMSKWKDAQRRTPSDDTTEGLVHQVIGEVACHETDLQRQIEQGKAFAEHNKTVFEVAMAVEKFYKEQLDLRMDAYARERKALAENKELRERNEALKRQLDESNKQIEIHAKRERELESELDEYNDERNFI